MALTFPYFFALNLCGERLQSTLNSYEYGQRMKLLVQFLDADRSDFLSCQLHMSTYISSLGLSAKALTFDELASAVSSFNEQRGRNNPVVIDEEVKSGLQNYFMELKESDKE